MISNRNKKSTKKPNKKSTKKLNKKSNKKQNKKSNIKPNNKIHFGGGNDDDIKGEQQPIPIHSDTKTNELPLQDEY